MDPASKGTGLRPSAATRRWITHRSRTASSTWCEIYGVREATNPARPPAPRYAHRSAPCFSRQPNVLEMRVANHLVIAQLVASNCLHYCFVCRFWVFRPAQPDSCGITGTHGARRRASFVPCRLCELMTGCHGYGDGRLSDMFGNDSVTYDYGRAPQRPQVTEMGVWRWDQAATPAAPRLIENALDGKSRCVWPPYCKILVEDDGEPSSMTIKKSPLILG